MGKGKNWTKKEELWLAENWGTASLEGICNHLGRSLNAIKVRVSRMGLPPYLESGEYITMHQLILALGYSHGADGYKTKSWVENRGFPMKRKRVGKNTFKIVYLEDFWEWAEKNRSFVDFSRMEPFALGEEPEWVASQRSIDYKGCALQRKDPWTPRDDELLVSMVRQHRYTWPQISERLHRSEGSIQRRLMDLGVQDRPVRMAPHEGAWSEDDYRILADGIRNGVGYMELGRRLGKSEKAVRGKVYQTYITEKADKVRAYMGDGKWGDGAPIPNVKQGRYLQSTRQIVKNDLERLVAALKLRQAQLAGDHGFAAYWQRFMCMKWDDLTGCTAGCENCDECAEFERIQPQNCARCGVTFYERHENRFCARCRLARKKQAQRHWARTQKGR